MNLLVYSSKIQDIKECKISTIRNGKNMMVCILKAKSLLKSPKVKNSMIW